MTTESVKSDGENRQENETRELVRAEMERGGLSQKQVARESNVSQTRLNQWLNGNYSGDNEAIAETMSQWLRTRTDRLSGRALMPDAPNWVGTHTARRVEESFIYAHMAGDVAVIYGGAGLGKTYTAEYYRKNNPNVWIATMTAASSSLPAALERIALAVGIREVPMGALRIEGAIIERVKGTGGLLIVDEAQHLTKTALEGIRGVQDATSIGLALMGNESVYTQLTGGARQAHFAQLFSRLGRKLRLNHPVSKDIDVILDAWNIKSSVREFCRSIARQNGALRGLTKTLRLASMMAAGEGVELAGDHVKTAWKELGVNV